jgi:hypothetical protein
MKKGQVSLFVIVAVIVTVVLLVYFVSKNGFENVDPEVEPIYNYAQECLSSVTEEAVYYIGQTGGYFGIPKVAYQDSIAYYLHENKNLMPSKELVERELETYVNFIMPFCLNGFEEFKDFNVEEGEADSKIRIEDERVVVNLKYPLGISKGENVYQISDFNFELDSNLGKIHKGIKEIMDEQMKKTDGVCINCLYDISEKYGIYYHVLDTEENNTVVIVARDEQHKVYDEDYVFYFVNKLEEM